MSNDPVAIMQVRLNWKINYSGLPACLPDWVCFTFSTIWQSADKHTPTHTHTHMYGCVRTTCVWFVEWLPRSLVCQNDKGIDIVVYDKHHHSHRCIYFYFPFAFPPVLPLSFSCCCSLSRCKSFALNLFMLQLLPSNKSFGQKAHTCISFHAELKLSPVAMCNCDSLECVPCQVGLLPVKPAFDFCPSWPS